MAVSPKKVGADRTEYEGILTFVRLCVAQGVGTGKIIASLQQTGMRKELIHRAISEVFGVTKPAEGPDFSTRPQLVALSLSETDPGDISLELEEITPVGPQKPNQAPEAELAVEVLRPAQTSEPHVERRLQPERRFQAAEYPVLEKRVSDRRRAHHRSYRHLRKESRDLNETRHLIRLAGWLAGFLTLAMLLGPYTFLNRDPIRKFRSWVGTIAGAGPEYREAVSSDR